MMQKQEYEYKVSVIVPVYNPGKYLRNCLDSLVSQTMDKEQMEILLIDDGSTDNSLEICKTYASLFPYFHVYTKENGGVGDTRNYGMDHAKGKYFLFLDSDDTLTPETIKETTDFFDSVYDEVDLVTYKIVPYRNGKPLKPHFRYQYVKESGVYSLDDIFLFAQTTMNIVVKNDKLRFVDYLSQSEDQLFINTCLMQKNRIGYCSKGEYRYTRNDESAVGSMSYSYYMFEQQISVFETLLAQNPGSRYLQGLIMGNYSWMLPSDCIFPYHYEGKKKEEAIERIRRIIDQVDVDTILAVPGMDNFHRHFWISMKRNISPAILCSDEGVSVYVEDKEIYSRKEMEIIINKATVENKKGCVAGFVKSPVFNYTRQLPKVIGIVGENEYEVPVFDSINSRYHSTAKTNQFWGFIFEFDLEETTSCCFLVEMDGIRYETQFYLTETSGFNKKLNILSIVRKGYRVDYKDNVFYYQKIKDINTSASLNNHLSGLSTDIATIRKSVQQLKNQEKEIWLYCDSQAIGTDNGYLQYIHDCEKADGVERYYVYMGDIEEIIDSFDQHQRNYLIPYGSALHKILFLSARYVICSFIDMKPRIPFATNAEYAYYRDMEQPEVIYVGHGVLHADLTYSMSAERCKADKIVVSTRMETNVLLNEYHYREKELIPIGAPRYDFIQPDTVPQNRILYAPSWRKYLAARYSGTNMTDFSIMRKSDYFTEMMAFLKSEDLHKILEENDLYLDVKLHQNAKLIIDEMEYISPRITFITEKAVVENYRVFITDISSFVFDFVYLQRPVMYFVPDLDKIKSGMHSYRRLHVPLEEGFGALTLQADEAVRELKKIIENDYQVEEIYMDRMKQLFLPIKDCREKLYNTLSVS